jgi:site-specific DNA recombinase
MSEPVQLQHPEARAGVRPAVTAVTAKRAVIYLRVSTAKQADKDTDAEGYSLPAQREACLRKAEALGAEVVEEYLDRGESAKTTDRPEFQRMLARIRLARDVDYVILDKIDRFARNRRDDANTMFELKSYGAQLVSVKENIDETPAGQLLHAIMAGIAEFYSRNLATEALKGMTQKAKTGGTPGKAPIGYLNTRQRIDGREIRVVAVDPDRAPTIQWAFEAYATGEHTIRTLAEALATRGVASDRGAKRGRPLANSYVAKLLSNRYYLGYVTFKGTEYKGKHQPLITQAVFDQVQQVLDAHDTSGEKQRVHHHYLKGTIYCGQCQRRLSFTLARGRYPYFFCLGRHQRQTTCQQPYLDVEAVEAAVERFWRTVRVPAGVKQLIEDGLRIELVTQHERAEPEIRRARERVEQLAQERRRLARGVVTGSVPDDLASEEQDRIQHDLDQAKRILETSEMIYERIEGTLERCLDLLERVDEVYRLGSPRIRRLANQCFFTRLLLDSDPDGSRVTGSTLREPWATMLARDFQARMRRNTTSPDHALPGRGSIMRTLVPPTGFEPAHTAPEAVALSPELRGRGIARGYQLRICGLAS